MSFVDKSKGYHKILDTERVEKSSIMGDEPNQLMKQLLLLAEGSAALAISFRRHSSCVILSSPLVSSATNLEQKCIGIGLCKQLKDHYAI